MIAFCYYPFYLALFWYKDVVGGLLGFFIEFNQYVSSLLSVPLLLRTFFKPLKNEYRQGLVLFSILAGIVVKSVLLSISIGIIVCMLLLEFFIALFIVALPVGLASSFFNLSIFLK